MEPLLLSLQGAVALIRNLSPPTMQPSICSSCGHVFWRQSGLTHLFCSLYVCLHPNSSNNSAWDGLDYELAEDIPQLDDNAQSWWVGTEIFPDAGAPIHDTVQVQCLKMMTGSHLFCLLHPNNGNTVILSWIPIYVTRNSITSSKEDSLYLVPMPNHWSALSTHCGHGSNGRTSMPMRGRFNLYWRKS